MQNTVGINIKSHFNLWHTALRWSNAFQIKLTEQFVGGSHLTLTLEALNCYRRLVIFRCGVNLWMLSRNSRVLRNHLGHYTTQGFDTQWQWGYVQEQYVFTIARQYGALNRSTNSNSFVWVHVFTWLFTKNLFYLVLHGRHTSLTTNQNHIVDVRYIDTSIFDCCQARTSRTVDQLFYQRLQLSASQFQVQMLRTACISSHVWQVDFSLLCRWQFDLSFFSSIF